MLFIQNAYAQTAAAPQESLLVSFLPLIIMAGVFYFLVMRPQIRREKSRQEMRTSLQKGDNILTTGGFIAKITKLDDDHYILAELQEGAVEVRLARSAVEGVVDVSIPKNSVKKEIKKTPSKKAAPRKKVATKK